MLSQVGKYQIQEKIGVGGFGTVYKGRDPFIKRTVAIKTCQSDEEEIKKRFFREAEYAGNLHHPNVTTIYDFGVTEEGVPYIVQEFLTGEDLDKKIKRRDPIDTRERLRVLSDICDGLGYAHTAGIVHRDIKPANIRVLEDGTVKIMDFGIAKSMLSESTLTQTGITLGTASYLAPEQIKGEPVDPRTDIFSLGVLAYELFSLQKPFTGDHISTVLYKILHEEPPPPSDSIPGIPLALDALIFSMLAKDREKRPASCAEIRDTVRRIAASLEGSPATTILPPPIERPVGPDGVPTVTPSGGHGNVTPRPPTGPTPTPPPIAPRVAEVDLGPASGRPTPPDEGGGALKVFLAAIFVLIVGGAALWFTIFRPGARPGGGPSTGTAGTAGTAGSSATPATPGTPGTNGSSGPADAVPSTPGTSSGQAGSAGSAVPQVPPPAATAASQPTPPARPTAAPVPTTGAAFFRPTLVAELTLDGKRKGSVSPAGMRVSGLAAGPHRALFSVKDFMTVEKTFDLKGGETAEVRADFPPRGMLQVAVLHPEWTGAEVFLDGQKIGTAPLTKTVAAGSHRIEVRLAGWQPHVQSIEVVPDDRTRFVAELRRP